MNRLWLLCSFTALLAGCPDAPPTGGGDGGAEPGGAVITGGGLAGTSGGGGATPDLTCYDDQECPDDQYCQIPEGDFEGRCTEGCRDDDACADGQACDPITRTCGAPSCDSDDACPEGSYCSDDSTCEEGCRLDDACPGQSDDGRPLLCDPETRSCAPHSACCVPDGDQDSCEEVASAAQCEARGGQLMVNVLLCVDNPCGERCELDVDCEGLDAGDDTFYCDPDDGRCREGCREGECGGDLVCDPQSRICVSETCSTSEDCGEGRYCDPVDLVCASGCGEDSDCPMGLGCVSNSCVERCDPMADTCGNGAYCDPETLICRSSCARHEDCAESEACDPTSNRCVLGACRDDEPQGDLSGEPNNTFESASTITLVPIPSEPSRAIGRALERAVCGPDLDLYTVGLAQGERMRVQLDHDAGADLTLRLFSERNPSQALVETELGLNPDRIDYPAEGVVEDAQVYYIEVSGALDANDRVSYDLSVQTAPFDNACFLDPREEDEGDDDYSHATPLVVNGTSRFNDASVCVGDEDWYSLPLTVNDGLTVTLSTPIEAQPVRFNLYSIAGFGGITGTPPPRYSVGLDESVEDLNSGLRLYTLVIDRDSAGFDLDGEWLLAVTPESPQGYATYTMTVVHESAGGVCVNEGREPNNSVSEGMDLEEDFGFQLEEGQLSLGVANRILDGVVCSGDVDYYCLSLSTGDKLSASIASDTVIGSLEVRLVNGQGVTVGSSATHTPVGEVEEATLNGAPEGEYCVVVDGLGNAQGPYELTVTRSVPVGGACAEDETGGRNDSSATAEALTDLSSGQGLRFEKTNALMCEAGSDPADWYQFNVAQEGSRVCVMLDGFNHDVADLDVELFGPPVASGTTCTTDAVCESEGFAACINGTCQIDAARSVYSFDFELASQPRASVDAGQHYLRVRRGGVGEVSPYDLSVTVTPGRATCQDDWQELGDRNDIGGFDAINVPSRATQLGSGAVGLCDAWLCNVPGSTPELDWYQITVPPGQDRTVIINFESEGDGPLDLYYWGESATSMQEDILYAVSTTNTNYQCLNLRGGSLEVNAELGIQVTGGAAGAFINDGDQRIDYSLRVVPTDLDANPAGACPLFGAGAVDTCDPNDPNDLFVIDGSAFTETCWPEVALP